jgi:hypothetical protein
MEKCKEKYQTESTEVSSCGLGKRPESNIMSSYDHHSRQIIAAEGRAYLKNSPMPSNISMESGARVSEQAEEKHIKDPRIMV